MGRIFVFQRLFYFKYRQYFDVGQESKRSQNRQKNGGCESKKSQNQGWKETFVNDF